MLNLDDRVKLGELIEAHRRHETHVAQLREQLRAAEQFRHDAMGDVVDFVNAHTKREVAFAVNAALDEVRERDVSVGCAVDAPLAKPTTFLDEPYAGESPPPNVEATPFPIPTGVESEAVLERVAHDAIAKGEGVARVTVADDGVKLDHVPGIRFCTKKPGCVHYAGHSGACQIEVVPPIRDTSGGN
jgi:hypothetical protein